MKERLTGNKNPMWKPEKHIMITRECECGCGVTFTCSQLSSKRFAARGHGKKSAAAREQERLKTIERWKDKEYRKKTADGIQNALGTEKYSKKQSLAMRAALSGPQYRKKRSKIAKELWQRPEFREEHLAHLKKINSDPVIRERKIRKAFEAMKMKQSPLEKSLFRLLQDHFPDVWKYTGNGSILIGLKNPDFMSKQGNRIIELYGEYWHKGEDGQKRIAHFKKFGYDTLIIWEHELKNEDLVVERVKVFLNN